VIVVAVTVFAKVTSRAMYATFNAAQGKTVYRAEMKRKLSERAVREAVEHAQR
jgi:hypothetical protein